jgi:hypothetical protein
MNQKYILETCTLPLEPGQAVPVNLIFSLEVTPAGEVYRMECGPYGSHELTGGGRTRAYAHWAGYVTNARIYAGEAARRRRAAHEAAEALLKCTGAVEVTHDDGYGNVVTVSRTDPAARAAMAAARAAEWRAIERAADKAEAETVRGEPGPEAK